MLNKEKLISYEVVGGWPIYKKTLKELLLQLGAIEKDGVLGFPVESPILNLFPVRLESDVMGYGVNEQWFTEASSDGTSFINIFTEKELSKEKLDEYIKEVEEETKRIKDWYDRRQLEINKK